MSLVLPLFTESASKRLSNSVPHPWNVVSVVIMVASFMCLRIDAVFWDHIYLVHCYPNCLNYDNCVEQKANWHYSHAHKVCIFIVV